MQVPDAVPGPNAAYHRLMVARFLPGWAAMTTGRPVFLVGIFAYVLSWFLPVLLIPSIDGAHYDLGWGAFVSAVAICFAEPAAVCVKTLSALSALTNLLMVGAVFILLRRRGPTPRAVTISLALAAILNTYWFFLSGPAWAVGISPFSEECSAIGPTDGPLLAGYYVWLFSFVLVAIASHLHRGGSAARTR